MELVSRVDPWRLLLHALTHIRTVPKQLTMLTTLRCCNSHATPLAGYIPDARYGKIFCHGIRSWNIVKKVAAEAQTFTSRSYRTSVGRCSAMHTDFWAQVVSAGVF